MIKNNSHNISHQASRLKKIRLYLGLTRKDFGRILEISEYTVRSWELGAKKFTETSVKRVVQALNEKTNFACSFDWLMFGLGDSPISHFEQQITFDPIQFDSLHNKLMKEIAAFKHSNKEANIVIVTNRNFEPLAAVGDYVGLLPLKLDLIEGYINKLILIITKNNISKFGVLNKINRRYQILNLMDGDKFSFSLKDIDSLELLIWLRKLCDV